MDKSSARGEKKPRSTKPTKKAAPAKKEKKDGKRFDWKKLATVFGYLCCIGVMAASVVMVALTVYLVKVTANDDSMLNLHDRKLSYTTVLYYQDRESGEYKEYQRLDGEENRVWVELEDIPQHVIDAYIATEDQDFYTHHGVNFIRTFAAMINEYTPIKLFSSKTGASTITQQLVKNLTDDKYGSGIDGAFRKIREIFRAMVLEKQYSKDEILEAYLNTLRLSNTWAGVQAGANNYFGKDVSELTLSEAASLAGITKNPSYYNPYTNMENNLDRRDTILYMMWQEGKITEEQFNTAIEEELVLNDSIHVNSSVNSYFTDMVIDQVIADLMEQYGYSRADATDIIYNDGLKIYTTVNPVVQSAMEDVMENKPNSNGKTLFPTKEVTITKADGSKVTQTPQAAMVSVDYEGRIVGVVGGLGEKTEDRVLNRAIDSARQTGSTMKPIGAYALGIEYGYINYSTGIYDNFLWLEEDEETKEEKEWPRNYNGKYSETQVPVANAIRKSLNTCAVRVLKYVTPSVSYDFLKNTLHISSLTDSDIDYAPLALGGLSYGISPLEMAAAYAIFGNDGQYVTPYCYTTVEDQYGEVILETNVTKVQAISSETAYIMNRALKTVLQQGGTGAGLAPKGDAVGKTGTTSDDKDHWFIGVTPYYATATWMGYDEPATLTVTNYGSHPPTTAWRNVMNEAQKDLPSKSFPKSNKVVAQEYCVDTGNIANANCPNRRTGYYLQDDTTLQVCQQH